MSIVCFFLYIYLASARDKNRKSDHMQENRDNFLHRYSTTSEVLIHTHVVKLVKCSNHSKYSM